MKSCRRSSAARRSRRLLRRSPASGIGPSSGTFRMPHLSSLYGLRRSTRSRKSSSCASSSSVRSQRRCCSGSALARRRRLRHLLAAGNAPAASAADLLRLFALAALALLDLRRAPLELPDLQRQQHRVVALQARLPRQAVRSSAVLVRRPRRRRATRAAGRSPEISACGRRAAGWPDARRAAAIHRLENGLLLVRRQVLEDLDLLGARRLGRGARASQTRPKAGTQRHRPARERRLEKFGLTIRVA